MKALPLLPLLLVACAHSAVQQSGAQCPQVTSAAPPPAQTASEPPVDISHRSPEMAQEDFFTGTWSCDVHQYPVGPRPERRYKSTIATKHDLGGNWTAIRNSSEDVTVAGFSGYDRNAHKFVRVAFDSFGGMETKSSEGWKGDDWIWSGTTSIMGKEFPLRHTLTKHGDHEFLSNYEIQFGPKWVLVRDETCHK